MNFLKKTVAVLFGNAHSESEPSLHHCQMQSTLLARDVSYDVYLPPGYQPQKAAKLPLVLFNDGQDLPRMDFLALLENWFADSQNQAFLAVGIHCNARRIREYGTVQQTDYKGRGDLAPQYTQFILEEFLPHFRSQFKCSQRPKDTVFAGFSLGGLSAMDIVWAHPEVFGAAGVFSGALWWRSTDVIPDDPDADRIMHEIVQKTTQIDKKQRFWFQCGTLDEEDDRNNNGIIDSIDDTLDLLRVLRDKGIPDKNLRYLEIKDGRHEPRTWGEAMPDFLRWALPVK